MTAHTIGFRAADRWLQALLTWTPGQTDMIKTVALVLDVKKNRTQVRGRAHCP